MSNTTQELITLTARTKAKPSAIRKMLSEVTRLNSKKRVEGLPLIINLTVGQPHLPPNPRVIEKLNEVLSSGRIDFGYSSSAGREETLKAIVRLYQHYFPEINYQLDEVMCSIGASFCLYLAFSILVSNKDQAIGVFPPYFSTYQGQVESAGGTLITLPITGELRPDFVALDAFLSATPQLKGIILNYPCNPTGIVLSRKELQQLAMILKNHPHILIILDDVYRDLNFKKHETLLNVDPSLKERILVLHSTAKGLIGAPDIRAGFMGGPARFINAMIGLQQLAIASTPYLTQAALIAAIEEYLTDPENSWQRNIRKEYQNNVALAEKIAISFGFKVIKPQGAFYLFVQTPHLMNCKIPKSLKEQYQLDIDEIKTDFDLANYFLKVAGVAIVPGSGFGMKDNDGYFRISCATPTKTLLGAMELLGGAADKLLSTHAAQRSRSQVVAPTFFDAQIASFSDSDFLPQKISFRPTISAGL
jgi:aspartate aminotransferase